MNSFYLTYGCNTNLDGCFSVIKAADYTEASTQAFAVTGGKFAFLYPEAEWTRDGVTQEDRYGLTQVELQPQVKV